MGLVITVSGAVGGIGASTFAYAMALQVATVLRPEHRAVVIDAQSDGVPLDLVVGAEAAPGIRWSQVQVRSADIAADTVLSALPGHAGVAVLSADERAVVDGVALGYLVETLRREPCVLVLDIPARHPLRESVRPDADVLLLPPTMGGIVAAHISMRPETKLVQVDVGRADVSDRLLAEHLGRAPIGMVRWQRSVMVAAAAGAPLPQGADVMRVSAAILGAVGGPGTD